MQWLNVCVCVCVCVFSLGKNLETVCIFHNKWECKRKIIGYSSSCTPAQIYVLPQRHTHTHTHTHTLSKWLFLRTGSRKPQSACCQLAKLQCRAPSQHTDLPPETLSLSFSYTYSLSHCFIVHLSFISHSFNTWVLSPWCAEPLFLYINVFFRSFLFSLYPLLFSFKTFFSNICCFEVVTSSLTIDYR